jgi:hypothetical protein
MKKLRLFIIVSPEEQKAVDFSLFEYEQVHSIVILDQEDMEENVAQLLDCNLVVNCSIESSAAIQNSLLIARILNRDIIHFSKLPEYVK